MGTTIGVTLEARKDQGMMNVEQGVMNDEPSSYSSFIIPCSVFNIQKVPTMHVRSKLDVGTTIGVTLEARKDQGMMNVEQGMMNNEPPSYSSFIIPCSVFNIQKVPTMHVRSKLDVGTTIGFTLEARKDQGMMNVEQGVMNDESPSHSSFIIPCSVFNIQKPR